LRVIAICLLLSGCVNVSTTDIVIITNPTVEGNYVQFSQNPPGHLGGR